LNSWVIYPFHVHVELSEAHVSRVNTREVLLSWNVEEFFFGSDGRIDPRADTRPWHADEPNRNGELNFHLTQCWVAMSVLLSTCTVWRSSQVQHVHTVYRSGVSANALSYSGHGKRSERKNWIWEAWFPRAVVSGRMGPDVQVVAIIKRKIDAEWTQQNIRLRQRGNSWNDIKISSAPDMWADKRTPE